MNGPAVKKDKSINAGKNEQEEQQQQQIVVTLSHPLQIVSSPSLNELEDYDDEDERQRRESLARRPSYRKILNDIDDIASSKMKHNSESNLSDTGSDCNNMVEERVLNSGNIQLMSDNNGQQTITMQPSSSGNVATRTTIVQYAQNAEGQQFFIPVSSANFQMAPNDDSLSNSPSSMVPEEASRKREVRLLKNREAARECRRKKKEYVKCLENRVAVLENQNKALIEELKSLKELYCSKDDGI